MTFLFPAFLFGALAVAIPVALHFMRRDVAPEVLFTAVRLLQRAPLERPRRRRLRDLLLLAARVAALLLLAIAFARPYIAGVAGSGSPLRIVAIDRSFSMGAPRRFERALDLARAAIDEASRGERVGVIAFDDRAEVLAEPGAAADARAALNGLRSGHGGTRYAAAIERAVDMAGGAPARLIIVSDLQRSGWEGERRLVVPSTLDIGLRDAGAAPGNAALAAVRVEAERLVVTVRNAGAGRRGQVSVSRDGQGVAGVPYVAGADATIDIPVPFRSPQGGSLVVALDDAEGFAADNTRYVLLDRAPRTSVLLLTRSGAPDSAFYLARALGAADPERGDEGLETRVVSGAALAAMTPDELARHCAVAVLSTRGLDRRGRENLRALVQRGGGVFIAAGADVEPAALSATFDWKPALAPAEQEQAGVTLAATDLRHPIFRPFGPLAANLGQVRFDRAWRISADGWDVAARFTDGTPALLERASGDGRVVLFASDVDRRWNDFPLHPSFVPFAVEAVRYVTGARDATSEYVVSRVPAGTPAEPGIYRAQPGNRAIAVNVDVRESGIARIAPDEFVAMLDRVDAPAAREGLSARQAETSQGFWRYGLMLMIAALVAESVVGRA